jgi:hypothetical protein
LRRQPTFERLETMRLLSGVSQAVAITPPITVRRSVENAVALTGRVEGTYHASMIPDAGKTYTFSGHGRVRPLHKSDMTGNVHLPGLLFTPEGGSLVANPTVDAYGQVFLSDARGTLTLTLTAPSHDNANTLPAVFSYRVTNASGRFRHDSGTGQVVIVVDPGAAGSAAGPLAEHGTFTLVFVPAKAASNSSS